METLFNSPPTDFYFILTAFVLVFVFGVAFGYFNGFADGKTAPPKLASECRHDWKVDNPRSPVPSLRCKKCKRSRSFIEMEAFRQQYAPPLRDTNSYLIDGEVKRDVFGNPKPPEFPPNLSDKELADARLEAVPKPKSEYIKYF